MRGSVRFTDKVVVVTGAAGNLGRAVCDAFASQKAIVVPLDIETNLLDPAVVDRAVQKIMAEKKKIDVLCNLAGGFRMGKPVHETSDADWDFLFDLNVRTVLHMSRAVVPHMLAAGGGKVVHASLPTMSPLRRARCGPPPRRPGPGCSAGPGAPPAP